MCLILFAHQCHPEYKLIVAANRDEFYERPTLPAGWWDEHPDLLAGKDLVGKGSWFGITRTGRFAAITNIREPDRFDKNAPSRGPLVTNFLTGNMPPAEYAAGLLQHSEAYNGFNLLVGDLEDLYYVSNRKAAVEKLPAGIFGLSNDLLDTPWPKVENGKRNLKNLIRGGGYPDPNKLLDQLYDRNIAPDAELPKTGVPLEWERSLSAVFIESPRYGTRCSTILLINSDKEVFFKEKGYIPESERKFHFNID